MIEELTPREKQAARMAASGHSNREVAEKMRISEGTMKQYLHRAFEKLGVEKRGQLQYKVEPFK